jgi:hypothetical protein
VPSHTALLTIAHRALEPLRRLAIPRSYSTILASAPSHDSARNLHSPWLQSRAHCNLAQELSLDNEIDSPFAILAKDNDICWGGGRPDDITVIVSRVIDPTEEGPHGQNAALAAPQGGGAELGSSCASSSWHA